MSQTRTSTGRRTLAVTAFAGGLIAWVAAAAGAEPASAERIAVGQAAPAFSLVDTDGESYAPGDLQGERNLVLIFLRGTW